MLYLSYPNTPKPSMSFHGLSRSDPVRKDPLSIGPVLPHPVFNPLTSAPYQEITEVKSWYSRVNIAQVSFPFSCAT